MTQKVLYKQCNTDPYLLYRVNNLLIEIVIIYIDDMLEIKVKPELMDTIECIKKEYRTWSIGELEDFIWFTIKRNLTKMMLNISQPYQIYKMAQGLK